MNYIQNKLDKFRKNIYGDSDALFDRSGNNVSTQVENEFIEALTDYHNHIVEKIDKMLDDLHIENCDEDKSFAFKKKGTSGQVGYEIGIEDMKVKIGDLLQDTNPKE